MSKATERKLRAGARKVTREKMRERGFLGGHTKHAPVPLDHLNDNETRVLFALESNGPSKIGDVARVAWADWHMPKELHAVHEAKCNSWVRNALRRLVASGWAVKLGPGLYGPHESLEPRLGGLAVADAEDAHAAAERALNHAMEAVAAAALVHRDHVARLPELRAQLAKTWKALVAARKAVR